ncbi:MAG TPA: hypothetical protein VLJ59_11465 [Mycobacteriales bacterium]|nr:hypothetical protein [Mycobacteriales bacterium]
MIVNPNQHTTQSRWAAGDVVAPQETYVGIRLLYQRAGEVEDKFLDVVDSTTAKRILRNVFVSILMIISGLIMTGIVSSGGFFIFLLGVALLVWTLLPYDELLSDWHLVLDDRAGVAPQAYWKIYRSLTEEHRVPAEVTERTTHSAPAGRGDRKILRIRSDKYSAYVSVFAYGADLFLGWTLWRRQRPARMVGRWIADKFSKQGPLEILLMVEPAKALREVVHNSLRGAIEAAAAETRQQPMAPTFGSTATFGDDVPLGPISRSS